MKRTRKAITRSLAILAVIAAFIAIYVVVINGTKSDDKGKGKNNPGKQANNGKGQGQGNGKPPAKTPATYTVKEGDTLGAIAAKTGVKVSAILKLNPTVDAQTLVVGSTLKLR